MQLFDKKEFLKRLEDIIKTKFNGFELRFAKACRMPVMTLRNLFDEKRKGRPNAEVLLKLASGADVSVDWLLGRIPDQATIVAESSSPYGLSDDEREILDLWRNAGENEREIAKHALEVGQKIKEVRIKKPAG